MQTDSNNTQTDKFTTYLIHSYVTSQEGDLFSHSHYYPNVDIYEGETVIEKNEIIKGTLNHINAMSFAQQLKINIDTDNNINVTFPPEKLKFNVDTEINQIIQKNAYENKILETFIKLDEKLLLKEEKCDIHSLCFHYKNPYEIIYTTNNETSIYFNNKDLTESKENDNQYNAYFIHNYILEKECSCSAKYIVKTVVYKGKVTLENEVIDGTLNLITDKSKNNSGPLSINVHTNIVKPIVNDIELYNDTDDFCAHDFCFKHEDSVYYHTGLFTGEYLYDYNYLFLDKIQ